MHIDDLQDGQIVKARKGRAGRTTVEWENRGRFTNHRLSVQRNAQGKVWCVNLASNDWADCGPGDLCKDDDGHGATFIVEDYYLQIEGLEGGS